MKTIATKFLSALTVITLLLSVGISFVGCGNDDDFTGGTYVYESYEVKASSEYKIHERIFINLLGKLGIWDFADFSSLFTDETITFNIDESDNDSGEISIEHPYGITNYTDELTGHWTKEDDEIIATFYNGPYTTIERSFEFKDGYLIMTVEEDGFTLKVKYKQVE